MIIPIATAAVYILQFATFDYTLAIKLYCIFTVNPCLNGGLPLASQIGYHCLCSKDYHGRFCDGKYLKMYILEIFLHLCGFKPIKDFNPKFA